MLDVPRILPCSCHGAGLRLSPESMHGGLGNEDRRRHEIHRHSLTPQFTLCTCHVSAPFAALGIAPAWNKSLVELAVQQGDR